MQVIQDPKLLAAIVGVFGIVFTSLVAAFAYVWKAKAEERKSIRRVLYLLLEIRITIQSSIVKIDNLLPLFTARLKVLLKNKFGQEVEDDFEFPGPLKGLVEGFLKQVIEEVTPNLTEELLEPYEAALDQLSVVNPLLAHKLKGKHHIQKLVQLMHNYNSSIDSELFSKIQDAPFCNILTDYVDGERKAQFESIVTALNRNVLLVSSTAGWLQHWKIKLYIKKSQSKADDFSDIDQAFERLFKKLEPALSGFSQAEVNNSMQPTSVSRC